MEPTNAWLPAVGVSPPWKPNIPAMLVTMGVTRRRHASMPFSMSVTPVGGGPGSGAYTCSQFRSTELNLPLSALSLSCLCPHVSQRNPWMCLGGAQVEL